ncbi:MAG: hypothetical protein ACE15B_01660 [Bryobacteraceae bacterium]
MPTFTLAKTIEAKKLNKRTLSPLPEPEVSIPFGAILEMLAPDRDMDRFTYLGEPFQCRHEVLARALVEAKPAEPVREEAPAPPAQKFVWEQVASTPCTLLRAKVPGGWLVMAGSGLAFYPDPGHQWDGSSM